MKDVKQSWCDKFNSLLPSDLITVYTYQHKDILSQLDTSDIIVGHKEIDNEIDFTSHYQYMIDCYKSYSGVYDFTTPLLWAWPIKPNHRQYIKYQNNYSVLPYVRIDAKIPKSRVLLSNFDVWSAILCSENIEDCDSQYMSDLFKIDNQLKVDLWGTKRCYQAVLSHIHKDEIIRIKSCNF